MIVKLPLPDTTVILEGEENVKRRQLLKIRVLLPCFRVQKHFVCLAPSGEHVNLELFE